MVDVNLSTLWYWCLLLIFLIGGFTLTNKYKNRIRTWSIKYLLICYGCVFVLSVLFWGILDTIQGKGLEYWWVVFVLIVIKLITAFLLNLELHYYFSKKLFKWGILLIWFIGYDFYYFYHNRIYLFVGCLILIQSYRKYRANKLIKEN